ncbi:MAG: glycosyltransferase [Proteobacteria bacterium]|nr:glycosyltransferase [Pseudomonadota bacterium]
MRIALVVPGGVDPSGEYRVIPVVLALLRRLTVRHEVEVLAMRQQPQPAQWTLHGARVHNLGAGRTRPRAVALLRQLHRQRPFDVIHSLWSADCGMVAVVAARLLRRPSLVHVTGGEIVSLPEIGYGGAQSRRGRLRERLVLRLASRVSATSAPMLADLARLGIRARRIPLGVDLDRWPVRAPQPRAGSAARLAFVASLNAVKDPGTVLEAVARLRRDGREVHLDVVGEDVLGGRMQRYACELGLETCATFHGFLTQAQLRPLVERAALLVLASRHEAGPAVVLEAAVAGVPTVGTNVGHVAEWAGAAAVAVPVADPAALATALARLLDDEPRRLRLAHAAQSLALAQDADFTAGQFEAVYEELSRGGGATGT